jgi:DNA-binding response OmpR family regulator
MSTRRVLVAEDEESILASLEFVVRAAGHDVRLARDGEQAIAALAEYRPDLVLLDLMLPKASGLEVCRAVRADPALSATKVLMLTARGGSNDVSRGLSAGADAYMVKPFSTRELGERVREMLGA